MDDVEGRDEHADEHHGDEQAVDDAGEVYGTEAAAAKDSTAAGFQDAADTGKRRRNAVGKGVRLSCSARRPRKLPRLRSTGAQAGEIASISCTRSV